MFVPKSGAEFNEADNLRRRAALAIMGPGTKMEDHSHISTRKHPESLPAFFAAASSCLFMFLLKSGG